MDECSLGDRHLRLRDRAIPGEVDRRATEEMQDPRAALETLSADTDEVLRLTLEPGRHHVPIVVPDRAESLPVASIPPDDPVLDKLADRELVRLVAHSSTITATAVP